MSLISEVTIASKDGKKHTFQLEKAFSPALLSIVIHGYRVPGMEGVVGVAALGCLCPVLLSRAGVRDTELFSLGATQFGAKLLDKLAALNLKADEILNAGSVCLARLLEQNRESIGDVPSEELQKAKDFLDEKGSTTE